jgi:transcriptional regulator with GAF, ATPase, and Fis domain
MLVLPPREGLAALLTAANAVAPVVNFGFTRYRNDGRASLFFSYPFGLGEYVVGADDVPEMMRPGSGETRQTDTGAIKDNPEGAIQWLLLFGNVERIVSTPVPGAEPATRFWLGLPDPTPLTADQMGRLSALAASSASLLDTPSSQIEAAERSRRLELAAGLLPTLLHVLDVREVFDRLSETAKQALPHDMLLLALFNDDLTTIRIFAGAGRGSEPGPELPHHYPPPVTDAWQFDIVDDHSIHPREHDRPPSKAGARSSLRLPIRFNDRVIGGVAFYSFQTHNYTTADVPIGLRLAEQVAVGLSHYRLAEQSRQAAALRERAASLDMLDGLLKTLTGVLDIREVFDRVSEIAQKVLPHDALSIAEVIPPGDRVRVHASLGLGDIKQPFDVRVPDQTMVTDHWDYRILDDLQALPEYAPTASYQAGMRSTMYVSIRLEGRLFGGLNFYSRTAGRYRHDDVLIARRITDHVALALSHRRLAEQARINEELRSRTEKTDLLDALLAALIDSGDLPDVFGRISDIARKVLPHDAAALMVRIGDGRHARLYASSGFPPGLPEISEVPEELVGNPDWEQHILDDLSVLTEPRYARLTALGFLSLLRVPIRLEGRFAGALIFLSNARATFRPLDVVVARRMADRMAVTLAHRREVAAAKRADEATDRAAKLEARVRSLTDELDSRTGYRRVVGESAEWRQLLTQATQVAATETTVLLLGESGTGKEVVARFLHRASPRVGGPFIALNCAALPEQLLEAELFGYERGAYTGATQSKPGQLEQAAGGTLFLDEVGEMSPSAQAKFLRVLQEREFQRLGGTRVLRTDARIVAATNRDLQKAIANGQFREDLYYRLNVFAIKLPALRHRRDDVLPLSEAFLKEIGRGLGRPPAGISREARQLLVDYHWPGNVRELRNILERAAILCDGGLITSEHLAITAPAPQPQGVQFREAPAAAPVGAPAVPSSSVLPSSSSDLQSMERAMIEQALQSARFNKSKAAKALGLTRHQLYIRMRKYGFE